MKLLNEFAQAAGQAIQSLGSFLRNTFETARKAIGGSDQENAARYEDVAPKTRIVDDAGQMHEGRPLPA